MPIAGLLLHVRTRLQEAANIAFPEVVRPQRPLAAYTQTDLDRMQSARESCQVKVRSAAWILGVGEHRAKKVQEETSNALKCLKCKKIMLHPCIARKCRHAFCSSCVNAIWIAAPSRVLVPCPKCGDLMDERPTSLQPVNSLLQAVLDILVDGDVEKAA